MESCENDFDAIEAMGAELVGTQRPFLTASGVAMLASGRVATEADLWPEDSPLPRRSEAAIANLVAQDVNASAVRLPPSVHGRGDQGFAAALIALAREKGISAYIGEGANHWAAVHRQDAARVFRLAIEREKLNGPYHAVAEEGILFKDIATLIGKRLDVPAASISAEEATPHFTWMAMFAGMESAASSVITGTLWVAINLTSRPPHKLEGSRGAGQFNILGSAKPSSTVRFYSIVSATRQQIFRVPDL